MKTTEERLTAFLHSGSSATLLAVLALAGTYLAWALGDTVDFAVWKGLGLPSPSLWVASPTLSAWINVLLMLGCAAWMVFLNVRYNLLRDMTRLFAGLFLAMQAAQPALMLHLGGGSVMALTVLMALFTLYSCYNRAQRTPPVFLVFFLLAAGALVQYAFVAFIPVFFMGIAQMRVFNGRTFTASLLGIITPLWLCFAFGFIDFGQFRAPEFVSIVQTFSPAQRVQFYAFTAFTMAVGVTFCIVNLVKVFSYNSRSRSYNGFIALLLFASCIVAALDFTNIACYLPLLSACAAFQAAQFFVINIKKRSYIAVIGIIAGYAALYCWWILL